MYYTLKKKLTSGVTLQLNQSATGLGSQPRGHGWKDVKCHRQSASPTRHMKVCIIVLCTKLCYRERPGVRDYACPIGSGVSSERTCGSIERRAIGWGQIDVSSWCGGEQWTWTSRQHFKDQNNNRAMRLHHLVYIYKEGSPFSCERGEPTSRVTRGRKKRKQAQTA